MQLSHATDNLLPCFWFNELARRVLLKSLARYWDIGAADVELRIAYTVNPHLHEEIFALNLAACNLLRELESDFDLLALGLDLIYIES